jgi:hypothetical protein
MYEWYRRSKICLAYLADVHFVWSGDHGAWFYNLVKSSAWFTRGWTLQELIAPGSVEFYSAEWKYLNTRNREAVAIRNITGISSKVLVTGDLHDSSVAQRMSWAAKRRTTRAEDMAYCLFGLLDINMPLLYGEGGRKAFLRLQDEIIKTIDDPTIFAWKADQPSHHSYRSLFAASPAEFSDSGHFIPRDKAHIPFSNINRGLQITLPAFHAADEDEIFAILDCESLRLPDRFATLRPRLHILTIPGTNQSVRIDSHQLPMSDISSEAVVTQDLYFPSKIKLPKSHISPRSKGLIIRRLSSQKFYYFFVHEDRAGYGSEETETIAVPFPQGEVGQPHKTLVIFTIDSARSSPDHSRNRYNFLEISFYAQEVIQELPNKPTFIYPAGFIGLKWYQSPSPRGLQLIHFLDSSKNILEGSKEVEGIEGIGIQLSSSIKDDDVWVVVDFVDTSVASVTTPGAIIESDSSSASSMPSTDTFPPVTTTQNILPLNQLRISPVFNHFEQELHLK